MKSILFLIVLFFQGQNFESLSGFELSKSKGPSMRFETTTIDYGVIVQGANPLRKFVFKNTSNEAIFITNAKGSCGCTVPTYPKDAIAPGSSAEIEVRYDTSRLGPINKSITVTSSAGEEIVLKITGEVVAKNG